MPLPDVLRALLTAPGPSGYESVPAQVWREAADGFAEVSGDVVGSSVARVKGTGDGPLLTVVGHIDEIGLAIVHIDDDGFLWFTNIGGWDPQILVGQRVELVTREGWVPGVVGKKPSTCSRRTTARRSRSSRTCTSTSGPRTPTTRVPRCGSATSRSSPVSRSSCSTDG